MIAPPTALPVADRYRIPAGGGISGAAEGVAGKILRRRALLQALGLGAEHLDDAAGNHPYPCRQRIRGYDGKSVGSSDQHSPDYRLHQPATLPATHDRSNANFLGAPELQLILGNVPFPTEYSELHTSQVGIGEEALEARNLHAQGLDRFRSRPDEHTVLPTELPERAVEFDGGHRSVVRCGGHAFLQVIKNRPEAVYAIIHSFRMKDDRPYFAS